MGSKHPFRKQFEKQIKSQEENLRNRIQKLTPSVEPKEDSLLMEPKREGEGGSLDLKESTTDPGFQDDSNKTRSDADSDRQKYLVPTTQGVTDLDVPHELDARIIEQNAYPWLDNKELQDSGCFPGTRLMWGIEPIYDLNAKIESGVVWEWNDTWRAKTLAEFWRSPMGFRLPSARTPNRTIRHRSSYGSLERCSLTGPQDAANCYVRGC
jgi:hypothetical protein